MNINKELLIKLAKNFVTGVLAVLIPFSVLFLSTNQVQLNEALGLTGLASAIFFMVVRTIISAYDMKKS